MVMFVFCPVFVDFCQEKLGWGTVRNGSRYSCVSCINGDGIIMGWKGLAGTGGGIHRFITRQIAMSGIPLCNKLDWVGYLLIYQSTAGLKTE